MKYFWIIISIIVGVMITIAVFPRQVEHAIVIKTSSSYTTIYREGKLVTIRKSLPYPSQTVINFKYNTLKTYAFQVVSPIEDRIMVKSDKEYDMEREGPISLSKKTFYYTVDKNGQIQPSDARKLIVGKYNIKSFKDRGGKLKTFVIFPMDYSEMRVGISTTNFSSLYHNKITLLCSSSAKLYSYRETFSADLPSNTILSLEPEEKGIKVTFGSTTRFFNNRIYLTGEALTIQTIKRGYPIFHPSYNGILEFTLGKQGILLINQVKLEQYLYKVVPSEMPLSGGLEALKCQAVAARTYAISDMLINRYASLGFYVDDSTQSQVYNNIQPQALSTRAVNATTGLILTYNDKPIDAKYYSTSSGTGVNYRDIWFNPDGSSDSAPYLLTNNYLLPAQTLPSSEEGWLSFYKNTSLEALDSASPFFRWHVGYSKEALTRCLQKTLNTIYTKRRDFMTIRQGNKTLRALPALEDLKDIRILNRSKGGNVKEISFDFNNVSVQVLSDYNVRSTLRCNSEFTGEATTLIRWKGAPLNNLNFLPSSFFSIERTEDIFTIYGGGYGHGVGMSQYGAMALSKKGVSYTNILNTYYKNVHLKKIY